MTQMERTNRFVVTGGPGAGKTTLVMALAALGVSTVPESGRSVIKAEVAAGGTALPWSDPAAFADRMLALDVAAYDEAAERTGPTVFDRGIPDVVGYLRLCNLPVPGRMITEARSRRYDAHVFVAPPWVEIYRQDEERRQSFDGAVATYRIMTETYTELGYRLCHLPLATVAERVAFVRAAITAAA